MYVADNIDKDRLYQGDIVREFPFFLTNEFKILDKKTDNLYEISQKQEAFSSSGEEIIAIAIKASTVAVLSQTCDIEHRENVIIAPVYSCSELDLSADKLRAITKRTINYWFYIPKVEKIIDDSIIDFQTIFYVPKQTLTKYQTNKILTMSDWGRHHLGWALSHYFGRPIENKN